MEANVNFTFRIAPALLDRVRCEAERNRRLVGAQMMSLIEAGLTSQRMPIRSSRARRPERLDGNHTRI
jgi:hypothetical protein